MPTQRQQALVLVALLYDSERVPALFDRFSTECEALTLYAATWDKHTPELRTTHILRQLKKLRQSVTAPSLAASFGPLYAEWFKDALIQEEPVMIAAILSLFKADLRLACLDLFPKETADVVRELLSQPKQAKQARDPELAATLERRFMKRLNIGVEAVPSSWDTLLHLSSREWGLLFQEVAYIELAYALYGLKKQAYLAILNRLPISEVKAIQAHIFSWEKREKVVNKARQERAQLALVSMDGERVAPELLSRLLGEYLFAKALSMPKDRAFVMQVLCQFSVTEGRRLLETLDRHATGKATRLLGAEQKRFLDMAKRLFPSAA